MIECPLMNKNTKNRSKDCECPCSEEYICEYEKQQIKKIEDSFV